MRITFYKQRLKDFGIKKGEIFVADFADFVADFVAVKKKPLNIKGF